MTNKQLEQRLADAAASLKTDLPFEQIVQAISDTSVAPAPLPRRKRPYLAAIAACIVTVLAAGGLWHHLTAPIPSDPPAVRPSVLVADTTVIDIDINPSVEITVDTADCILNVTAVNQDAQAVLNGLNLTQLPLEDGVKALFEALVSHGYATDGSNQILVTVQSADPTEADRLHALINSGVDAAMAQHNLSASVVNQTVTTFDEVAEFAQKHGISNGKAAFILNLAEQDPRLDAEALTDHAFAVLAAIAQHHNVPLSELVDYDATDGLWKDIINALSAELSEAEHRWGSMLSVSEVKALALKALPSDYIAENALVVRIDFSWEEEPIYRIELVSLGYLYEYTIHAADGTFLNPNDTTTSTTSPTDSGTIRSTLAGGGTRVPIDDSTQKPSKTTVTTIVTTTTTTTKRPTSADGSLTEERAKEIALFRMGITEDEARDLCVAPHPTTNEMSVYLGYDIYIYCFYMDISTCDVTKIVILPTDVPVSDFRLDEWDALDIALTHAHMTKDACGEITILYGLNNDAPFIDVVWVANNTSYYYRIDGVDGDITQNTAAPLGDIVIP